MTSLSRACPVKNASWQVRVEEERGGEGEGEGGDVTEEPRASVGEEEDECGNVILPSHPLCQEKMKVTTSPTCRASASLLSSTKVLLCNLASHLP